MTDDWWAVELYQFTSDETLVDLEIIFEHVTPSIVEGIEFRPRREEEPEVSHDEKQVDIQPTISDSDDTYWEQKLPNDYHDISKWLEDISVELTTKKEMYSILCTGFPISNGQELKFWFSLDKNGKKCLMLSARAAFRLDKMEDISWQSLPESRFGEALVSPRYFWNSTILNITKSRVLSPQTGYGSFIVYKMLEDQSKQIPMKVKVKNLGSDYWNRDEFWYIHFVSPLTPIIRPKVGQNTHNPQNRPIINDLPQQRSDGWMEVQVYEFQTDIVMGDILCLEMRGKPVHVNGLLI